MIFRYKIKFISDIEQKIRKLLVNIAVTPFVGVWIEMHQNNLYLMRSSQVTPFVGVWIEIIAIAMDCAASEMSLPSWECGLKLSIQHRNICRRSVTPFVGVWIEIVIYCN